MGLSDVMVQAANAELRLSATNALYRLHNEVGSWSMASFMEWEKEVRVWL